MPTTKRSEEAPSRTQGRSRTKAAAPLRQVAAVPVRRRLGRLEVCLVTTRETRRWTVPKGWPMRGKKDHRAAEIEAEQEAGVIGVVRRAPLGEFQYWKRQAAELDLVNVVAYRLDVVGKLRTWPEQFERDLIWVPLEEASDLVQEPGLSAILAAMDEG
jgi:hypothetical protein